MIKKGPPSLEERPPSLSALVAGSEESGNGAQPSSPVTTEAVEKHTPASAKASSVPATDVPDGIGPSSSSPERPAELNVQPEQARSMEPRVSNGSQAPVAAKKTESVHSIDQADGSAVSSGMVVMSHQPKEVSRNSQ